MKNFSIPFILLIILASLQSLYAQPANDDCSNAMDISSLFDSACNVSNLSMVIDNTGATPGVTDPPEPGESPTCPQTDDTNLFGDASENMERSVWFTFTIPDLNGDGSDVSYSLWTSVGSYGDCGLNPNNILGSESAPDIGDTQVAIYETNTCPDNNTAECDYFAANEDLFTTPPWISGWLDLEFTPGNTYYMVIDSWDGAEGEFCLSVTPCGTLCGDGACAPVETYCDCVDCRDECPYANIIGIDHREGGTFGSPTFEGGIFVCSELVRGFASENIYLGIIGTEGLTCQGDSINLPIELSVGSLLGSDPDGLDTLSSGFFSYVELTPEDIAAGSITITSSAPDGLGETCTSSLTLNFADYPQTSNPYCELTCYAGSIEENLLTNGITVCEDGNISLCTDGLEDLTLPCEGGTYDYYWRAYVDIQGVWTEVTGWIQLGACPNVPVSDLLIDSFGYLPPDFTPGLPIPADQYGSILIEGAARCAEADGTLVEGCFATNGPDFFTDVNGDNRTVIPVTYLPAGDAGCDMGCTQTINLNAGWNLISFDVTPATTAAGTVFGGLQAGNLEIVTGFDNGALAYDPDLPPFLNTLKDVADGFGYWVKVTNADVLNIEGDCIDDSFRKPLDAGWNLIAYPPDAPQPPATYLGDLISSGNLEIATGFDNGSQSFDPDLPPFLNTLQQMQNGFGYWVKVTNSAGKKAENVTNIFSFFSGTSNLPKGEHVNILNKEGEVVALINVVQEDGYLMTTPVYGDDLTTNNFKEGVSIDETLSFSWNHQIVDFTTTFKGDYGMEKINLEFKLSEDLTNNFIVNVYPIPANYMLNFEVDMQEQTDLLLQIFDNKGSLIQSIDNTSLVAGKQIINYNVENLAVGIYAYQLITGNQLKSGKFNVVR